MFLKYFYDEKLAQASYLVGCPADGTAIVIDPAREITPYINAAAAQGLHIAHVAETHIHADYVSGTRELAAATGAQIYLSELGGPDWQYDFPDTGIRFLREGDTIMVGSVRLEVLHTPGHTPEHIVFVMTDTAAADQPIGIFTGDFLFAGDVGRPDLLEEAAGYADTKVEGARQQFRNVERFKSLPDYLQIWPGHGAGSVCGKALGAIPSTTLGYEKLFNPAFQFSDEGRFVDWLLSDQPEPPRYFAHMKHINRVGPPLLREIPQAQHIREHPEGIVPEDALFIDTRPEADFAARHIPGTVNIPINSRSFNTYAGWYVDYGRPVFFIAYKNDAMTVLKELFAIGVDDVPGYFTNEVLEDGPTARVQSLSPQQVYEQRLTLLDVRGRTEYEEGHVPDALHIPMGYVLEQLHDIPQDRPLAIYCSSGTRSQIVVSLLQKYGLSNLVNITGGLDAWKREGLPLEQGAG